MEYTDSIASRDMQKTDDNCLLKDLSLNTTADSGPESDNSQVPDKGISETSPRVEQTDSSYTVTCTVNIVIAILKEENEEHMPKNEPPREVVDVPRHEGYYCIEYNLLPDDTEPTRVDLVMYGLAASVYMTNETKLLKPWREGNQVWVGWSQTLKLNVTRDLLIKMASHKIIVKVWDNKHKVSPKARNDGLKALRLPQRRFGDNPDEMAGIKKMVCKLRAIYEKENRKTRTSMKDTIRQGLDEKMLFQKLNLKNAEFLEVRQRKEAASLELNLASLLAGAMTLTDCLGHCSGEVNEGFWNITLDQPLISELLRIDLNPLVITILSASSLPSSPVPFDILKEKCLPVYCRYKFHNMPLYKTKGHDHSTNIYFKDINVIFTGLLSPGKLREFLRGPPLEIEVHDRDIKKPSKLPAVFGTEPDDERFSCVDLDIIKRTVLKSESELHHPYGIAKLDLSDLLTGCRYLKYTLDIRCPASGSFESFSDTSLPKGHYIEADSHLNVHVKIAYPLDPEGTMSEEDCPFGRVIYNFKYNNTPALAKLTSEIQHINSEAFQLDGHSEETIERVLSDHKMSAKDRENKSLDVLTGFHLMDKTLHLFVLEGLKNQAVKRLWTNVPMKLGGNEEEQVTVMYNSGLNFSERLYDTLDVGLNPIYLLTPLEIVMSKPLLFIRNMVPHGCLEAMNRISRLRQAKKLIDVVHNNLFPTADMLHSLSKEFGLVLSRGKLELETEIQKPQDIPDQQTIKKTIHKPLDNFNREYLQWKQQQDNTVKDFIEANIKDVCMASIEVQKSKPKTLMHDVDGQPINDVQAMNSAQGNKLLFRDELSTGIPFTYPGFRSSIESNQHPQQLDDARIEELRKPWRENILHKSKLMPNLSRSRLPWSQRHQDFQLYSKPKFGTEFPLSIHLAGETQRKQQLQTSHAQYNRSKMFDEIAKASERLPEFKFHVKRANLDKLEDILKDKPTKYSLRRPGMILKPIPVTSVVRRTDPAESAEREANIPFAPGPLQHHSLGWDKNAIPRHASHKFHFRDYWGLHSFQYKRGALPLTDEERRIYSIQKPDETSESRMTTAHFKHNRNITEMRTNKDVTLHMK